MKESTILNNAYLNYRLKKNPQMKPHQVGRASFKVTKNKERIIKDKICKYLKWIGQLGIVVDSSAHYNANADRYVKSETTTGTSDIIACIDGCFYGIELKRIYATGRDTQKDNQKEFERRVNESGGCYVIVNDFMSFYEWLLTIKQK